MSLSLSRNKGEVQASGAWMEHSAGPEGLPSKLRASGLAALATTRLVVARMALRRPGARLAGITPHWKPVLLLLVLLPAFGLIMLDPVYITGRSAWHPHVVSFGRTFHTFGKSGWYLWPAALFLIATAFVDWRALGRRSLARLTALTQAAWFAGLSLGTGETLSSILKQTIGRARPRLHDDHGLFAFQSWTLDSAWASFPSGHATTFGALACVLALLFPRFKWFLLCAALWLASTRVIVGAHYPSDVLAGLIFGAWIAYAWAVWLARRRILFKVDDEGRLATRWVLGAPGLLKAAGRRAQRPAGLPQPRRAVLA
jgi:membrane-associated phospholipid phosphatase